MPCRRPGGFWSRKRLRLAVRSSLGCANSANCCVVGERLNSTLLPTFLVTPADGSGGPGNGHSRQSTGHADDRLTSVSWSSTFACLQIGGVEALGEPAVIGRHQ